MIDRSLIRRYVAALHDLAAKAGQTEAVQGELARLQAAVRADARLLQILRHPQISAEEKRALLARLVGETPSELMSGFLGLLLEKERVGILVGVADAFTELRDEAAGLVRAQVEVAWEPDDEQKQRLCAALSLLVGAPVVADFRLVPEVIGGARVRVRGRLIDGSLAGGLDRLLDHLRQQPAVRAA